MFAVFAALSLGLMSFVFTAASAAEAQDQPKYSSLSQINAGNVANLELAWEYHTHEPKPVSGSHAFEDEPRIVEGNLIVCTPTRRIIALDPATGQERWVFDPKTPSSIGLEKCRGVATWTDPDAAADAQCKTRIMVGTGDYRLIAVDAKTGKPCEGFGTNGQVQMEVDKPELFPQEVSANSTPVVVNGVVVVGSIVEDDQRVDAPSGRVQAFDARTGNHLWNFDPIPRSASDPAMATWQKGTGAIGGANVWGPMAVDEALGYVFLPTTSPSGDFTGGTRPGANVYANSLVALKAATGEVMWYFQFVHHDLWDYDIPTAPILIDYPKNGEMVPALIQNTKMGMIYIFNRKTGEPLIPIEERPVPQEGAIPGEWLSPTQPFPVGMPNLTAQKITPDDAWGFTPIDKWFCRREIEKHVYGPIYTPPSTKGTIYMPPSAGGVNWGGGAYDPQSRTMVVPSNQVATVLTLLSRDTNNVQSFQMKGQDLLFPSRGAPYATGFRPLLSPLGAPCTAPPWVTLTAIDIPTGQIRWQIPLGTIEKLAPIPLPWTLGAPGAGGPLITGGGLVFIGYTSDDKFRAFDLKTGKTLWTASLPAAAMSVPATYEADSVQYIVVPAGGHGVYTKNSGDSVMAYKLKPN